MNLEHLINKHQAAKGTIQWEGTFSDYLNLVKEQPFIAQNAHARLYHMIMDQGVTIREDGSKHYHFFEKEVFGIDHVLEKLVESYFHPAALGLDVKKRLLLLMGPVSGGKSSIAIALKRGLEAYSKTDRGATYAIDGCPMNQEPLLLIPDDLRPSFEKELGIRIEGYLNPYTQLLVQEKYDGDILKVKVKRIFFSENSRTGIGTFSPSDPKSQDISDLTGSIDFATLATYGSESDPRAYRFDGELNIANRGLMEFQEVLKCDEKFLWHLLSLTQEGNFKAGRFALISADEMILAHTNETEYQSFIKNKKNEALHSRTIVINVPYNLNIEEEVRIYQKSLRSHVFKTVEFAPHTLESIAIFSIMTRFSSTTNLQSKLTSAYSGVQASETDGMHGIDPRYVINKIAATVVKHQEGVVTAVDILKEIAAGLHELPSVNSSVREDYVSILNYVKQHFAYLVEKDITDYLDVEQTGKLRTQSDKYLAELVKSTERDEKFMREIEDIFSIGDHNRNAFREEILVKAEYFTRKGQTFDLSQHPQFANIQTSTRRMVFSDLSNDEKALEFLIKEKKYSERSAQKAFGFIASLSTQTDSIV